MSGKVMSLPSVQSRFEATRLPWPMNEWSSLSHVKHTFSRQRCFGLRSHSGNCISIALISMVCLCGGMDGPRIPVCARCFHLSSLSGACIVLGRIYACRTSCAQVAWKTDFFK